MKRLFIAGPSTMRPDVAELIERAREKGLHITYDWTRSLSWDQELSPVEIARLEVPRNLLGVFEADAVLWVIHSDHPSQGAHYEAGYARALGKPVIVLAMGNPGDLEVLYPWMAGAMVRDADCAFESLEARL